jgi:hypothetical protein
MKHSNWSTTNERWRDQKTHGMGETRGIMMPMGEKAKAENTEQRGRRCNALMQTWTELASESRWFGNLS